MLLIELFLLCSFINISLGKDLFLNIEHEDDEPFVQFIKLDQKQTVLNVISNVSNGFFIVQLHTYNYPLILSQTLSIEKSQSISGTNIGLYIPYNHLNVLYVFATQNCTALLAITHYDSDVPIPGGCNLAFQNQVAPYMKVYKSQATFTVEYQMPSINGYLCEENPAEVKVYYYYLTEWRFTEISYFDAIKMMMTTKGITSNANEISKAQRTPHTRRSFNYYKGMVTVYSIVAKYHNLTSAYVPAASFACDIIENGTCEDKPELAWSIVIPMALFVGIFLYTSAFLTGLNFVTHFLTASLWVFIMIYVSLLNASTLIALSTAGTVAVTFGLLWVYCWTNYCYKPHVSACANYATLGLIIALLLLNVAQSVNVDFLNYLVIESFNYWTIFTVTILLVCVSFATFHPFSDYYAAMVGGSFIIMLASSYYYGAYIHYIVVNFARRLTIENYKYVVTSLPFDTTDCLLLILWLTLLFVGYAYKIRSRNGYESF